MNKNTHHPVLDIVGASRFHCIGDLQHTGNLGSDQWLIGSVIDDIIEHGPFQGGNKESRKDRVWGLIKIEYAKQGTSNRLGNLTLGMIKGATEQFPCLGAKAAETMHLVPVITEVCRTIHDGSDHDEHRLRCLEHLANFYRIIKAAGIMLSDQEAIDVKEAIDWHLLHYNWLNQWAVSNNFRLYVIQFKHHNLWHIADHAKFLNPRFIWCYPFEDFVGILIISARNCMAGSHMRIVGRKVIENSVLVDELTVRHEITSNCEG